MRGPTPGRMHDRNRVPPDRTDRPGAAATADRAVSAPSASIDRIAVPSAAANVSRGLRAMIAASVATVVVAVIVFVALAPVAVAPPASSVR